MANQAQGPIEKIYFKDKPNQYGKYITSIKVGGNWYVLSGRTDNPVWNKKVGDSFHKMKEGDSVSLAWEPFGQDGRTAKRSQIKLLAEAPEGGSPQTPSYSTSTGNNPAEVGQLVNIAWDIVLSRNPKTADIKEISLVLPTIVDDYLRVKAEADSILTAAKKDFSKPEKSPDKRQAGNPDDFDDDIPF